MRRRQHRVPVFIEWAAAYAYSKTPHEVKDFPMRPPNIPDLDPMAIRVLQILLERSNIAGAELMRSAGVTTATDLMNPINQLRKEQLIQVSGDIANERTFPFASFGIRPSAKEFAYYLARAS
jgi:hypothetical protein